MEVGGFGPDGPRSGPRALARALVVGVWVTIMRHPPLAVTPGAAAMMMVKPLLAPSLREGAGWT